MATKRPRPKITYGDTEKVVTNCGNFYITVNRDTDRALVETFATLGKTGGCAMAQTEAITGLISLCLRCGINAAEIVKQLSGIRCPSQSLEAFSCADAIAKVLARHINGGNA